MLLATQHWYRATRRCGVLFHVHWELIRLRSIYFQVVHAAYRAIGSQRTLVGFSKLVELLFLLAAHQVVRLLAPLRGVVRNLGHALRVLGE